MNRLKSLFISAYLTLILVGLVRAVVAAMQDPAWGWVVLALSPALAFFLWVLLFNKARTGLASAIMWLGPLVSMIGMAVTGEARLEPWWWTLGPGLVCALLYVLWYSRFGRRDSPALQVGATLPELTFDTANGEAFSIANLNAPLLLVFYRGNWCPLCMAQIKEIAAQYQALAEKGVQLLMISPQSHDNTASLAQKFDVPMQFLVDRDLRAAKALGIEALAGLPAGLEALGYDSDTVMPTVIITDRNRTILFADQTDNYRVRPEPETFLRVLAEAQIG